jgi:ribosomal protein S18 acetylase RimI-like enzyme
MTELRLAGPEDAPAIHALLAALVAHEGGDRVGSLESLLRHGFGERPLFRAILAEDAGQTQGLVLFYPDYSTVRGEAGVFVQDLFVAEGQRGRGLGRKLLAAARDHAGAEWNARYLTLSVSPDNRGARTAYDAMGFRPRGYEFLILDGRALAALEAA